MNKLILHLFTFCFLLISCQNKQNENQSVVEKVKSDDNESSGFNVSTDCSIQQKEYLNQKELYWQEYRKSDDNELLSDEAQKRFLNFCNSYSNIKNWRGKLISVSTISDGTSVIDLEYCNSPITLLVSNLPESVMREMREGVILVFSGIKHYDRLNGEFLKGSYNSEEVSFSINNSDNTKTK